MRVGFIGLGSMGAAIAHNLLDNNVEVVCWNRSPGPREELASAGAIAVDDVRDVLREPVYLSMLANDAAFQQVFSEEALKDAADGSIHVALATLSVDEARAAAARHERAGVGYLAAPVIGRPPVARSGQLNIIAGGPEDLLKQVQPILDVVGAKTWYFGSDPSQANLVKACVNFNLIHTLEALGESIALIESAGIAPIDFVNLLTGSLYAGVAYAGYGDIIANRRYSPPGFSVELGLKDLSLAEKIAAEGGVTLPTAPALRRVFERTLANPQLRDLDWSAIAETIRSGAAQ